MTAREQFIAYITKYALTKGILERQVELRTGISPDMVVVFGEWFEHYHGNDWHRTRAAAVERHLPASCGSPRLCR